MERTWQVQEAKNRFSAVVEEALTHGPQVITRRGKETVVLLSYDEYTKLTTRRMKLSEFFRNSPMVGADLDLERNTSPQREGVQL